MTAAFVHDTAVVNAQARIGDGTKIWHFSHVSENAVIGDNCTLGQNVFVGRNVIVGDECKIQNNVSVFEGVTLEDGVFCGPGMTFINVVNPRARIERKHEFKDTLVRVGATIGANATVLGGVTIGRFSFIGAGAVVTRDVADYALVIGNPARPTGWVCRCGEKLADGAWTEMICAHCGAGYERSGEVVRERT